MYIITKPYVKKKRIHLHVYRNSDNKFSFCLRSFTGKTFNLLLDVLHFSAYFYILFVVTAAGAVPCGSPKKRPSTTSIVQFIFYSWSFEYSRNILRNQKILLI